MVLPKCYGFIKYALVWVNLVFWAVGLAAVVLAIWMLTDQTFLVSLAQEQHNFNAGLYIFLAAGLVMLVVAFLGCCGAFRESQCMLVGFFSCLLVVIVAQIAAGVWLYTNMDAFQSGLGCCGATGPADWAGSFYANSDSSIPLSLTVSSKSNNAYKVPKSCCKDKDSVTCEVARNLKIADIVSPVIYNEGCIDKLVEALKSQSCIVIGVAIAVGILELLGLIFALILCCASGSSDRYKA
uniref:Tetraspanin n=1 Tax=Vespula pensylvanica TaxID=30213 RepID=A0A834UCI4_VESPE|nr:hypothetical protein H0235_004434 [Vespula pensylvanica]